ncbi:type II secretion system protein GspM [Sphingomonas sp. Y38-1Y]|uniref:type II secretion system protein GspM n=1 Tax=Sphingomonas sp. Y38-1Y TaxID=3078265 RepID=UPI0028EAC215|nr:type II secretion system protein GspM [Sphingomonas sp. Y38-1Y]
MRIELRDPRLDAAIARFEGWWATLSQRERVLLTVLGLLIAGAALVYGVIKPLQAARAEARADIRTYETLSARIRAVGKLQPQTAQRRTGSPVEIVQAAAQAQALSVAVEPQGGGVRAVVSEGDYAKVVGWLADLSRSSTLAVTSARIVRRPNAGMVEAQVSFAP